jgi:hypothetical protein
LSGEILDPETTAAGADFLVVDAVWPNRSARGKFPANRENSSELDVLGLCGRLSSRLTEVNSDTYDDIPCAIEQGIESR